MNVMYLFEIALIVCGLVFPIGCFLLCLSTWRSDNKRLKETRMAIEELEKQSEKFKEVLDEYKKTVRIEVSDSVLDYMKKDREI